MCPLTVEAFDLPDETNVSAELIEDAQRRGLLELQKDERSGGYLILSFGPNASPPLISGTMALP